MSALSDTLSPADLAAVPAHADLMVRYLEDLDELLDQLHVSGLAFPEPDLIDALPPLANRAQTLGLATAGRQLDALQAQLGQIIERQDDHGARDAIAAAFHTLQGLVAWRRLFERSYQLALVSGTLAAQGLTQRATPRPSVPTWTGSCWPLGLELDAMGRLFIYASDIDTGAPIGLRDHISDLDPEDPFAGVGISRLFQAAISLRRLMSGQIRLDAHPRSSVGGALHFAPAFESVAELSEVVAGVGPPPPETIDLCELQSFRGIGQLSARVVRHPTGPRWLAEDDQPISLRQSAPLRLNATKLLLGEAGPVPLIILGTKSSLQVLSAVDLSEIRVFPEHDPRCFRLWPASLFQRAVDADDGGPAGLWRLTWAAVLGGATGETLTLIEARWDAQIPQGAAAGLRRNRALSFLGTSPPDPACAAGHLEALARVSLWTDPIKAPSADIALLEGLPIREIRAEKRRSVEASTAWHAIHWAALTGVLDENEALVRQIYGARYERLGATPTVAEICGRAVLLAWIGQFDAQSEEGEYDDDLTLAQMRVQSIDFLAAHLASLRGGRTEGAPAPLPPLWAVHALASCRALVHGESTFGPIIEALGLSRMTIAQAVADALLDEPASSDPLAWGDALRTLSAGAPVEWLLA